MTSFLHWESDPLLLDPSPAIQNTWLIANELLETRHSNKFQTKTEQLLLYPIIIRKVDFISGERILQSFPYILLNQEWISRIRKQSLAHAEKAHHYFLGSNISKSIRDWQRKIISYLEEQQRLPFPLFRLTTSWEEFFQGKYYIQFQSARGEGFQLPLMLTEELAYLTGVIMGDGHLANYFVNIIDSSKEHIENLVKSLKTIFQTNIEFFAQKNAQAWNVNVLGKWIVRFFNFLSGQPINERKYPHLREPLLFQDNPTFRAAFWSGLMDADGGYKKTISFGTASKQLLEDFSNYLAKHIIQHRFYEQALYDEKTYSFIIAGPSRKDFAQLIGTNHPVKQHELQTLLQKKVYRFAQKTATLRKLGYWKGEVLEVNKKKLINGYFDLSFVPNLGIVNLGSYLKMLRLKHNYTQKSLASQLDITQTLLSKYERNFLSVPIKVLGKVLSNYDILLETFLASHSDLCYSLRSSHCVIETKPTKLFLNILQGLEFKDRGYIMIIGKETNDLNNYKQQLSEYFSIPIHSTRFSNSVLNIFVREFFILRI